MISKNDGKTGRMRPRQNFLWEVIGNLYSRHYDACNNAVKVNAEILNTFLVQCKLD